MLGDRLFGIALFTLAGLWVFGWVVLLEITLLQWLLPSIEKSLKEKLQAIGRILGPALKYVFLFALALFVIRLLAGWLGWASPL